MADLREESFTPVTADKLPAACLRGRLVKLSTTGKTYLDTGQYWEELPGGGAGSGDALVGDPLSQFAPTTSLQLKNTITDETGSGALVFANSPNITTPTGIVKGDVGLGNVDNTSDANKPVSTAQAAADALNLKIASNLSDLNNAATARTNLGLGNVNNTSDVSKPVSTAQAAADALHLKIASNLNDLDDPTAARENLGLGVLATAPAGSASIAFTSGDTVVRQTVTDAAVGASSRIAGSICRPTGLEADDKGYIYVANVVRRASGSFELLVVCLDSSGMDTTEDPPNETVEFHYTVFN